MRARPPVPAAPSSAPSPTRSRGSNNEARSPVGAIGVMQVMPATAAGYPVQIANVHELEPNIHAGVKLLRFIRDDFFRKDPMDRLNRSLMTVASYNAGPGRISRLRKNAAAEGLDPNKWFNNVELVVAREIGWETVEYVSNVHNYYLAYTMTLERQKARERARSAK
ncbi:MAG: transglycosylase SLT domain-containing protein [Thermoanaerobaculia bacterium]